MTEEQLNNIDNPLPNETFTAAQAIESVNRLLWSDNVEDDDFEDARLIKAFLVGTLPNIPVPVKHSKTIPVMETTIEGAQKRIAAVIDWYASYDEGGISPDLEYIGVFLDSVGDEMAAITSSCNSLHDRYVQALAAIDEWKERVDQLQSNFDTVDAEAAGHLADKIRMQREIDELRRENGEIRRGNLNNLHAAHDNR
jgi:archaellum component FlaC|tara:strand:+ start:614 stop:1204 length:591 start_codon:yes stop_codon:yes gene_type:complete